MQDHLLRQHLILSEKNQDVEAAWHRLGASENLPSTQSGLAESLTPTQPLSDGAYWYLVAKQKEFEQYPVLQLSINYSLVLLGISAIILGIFVTKILPVFMELFASAGADLPQFTLLVISNMSLIFSLIILLFLLLAIPSRLINQAIKKNVPIPNWINHLHIFNAWIKAQDKLVQSNRVGAWISAGIKVNFEAVTGLVSESEWQLALRNNTEHETITKLAPSVHSSTNLKLNHYLDAIVTLIVGLVVGSIVIAFYLPIFHIGSLV